MPCIYRKERSKAQQPASVEQALPLLLEPPCCPSSSTSSLELNFCRIAYICYNIRPHLTELQIGSLTSSLKSFSSYIRTPSHSRATNRFSHVIIEVVFVAKILLQRVSRPSARALRVGEGGPRLGTVLRRPRTHRLAHPAGGVGGESEGGGGGRHSRHWCLLLFLQRKEVCTCVSCTPTYLAPFVVPYGTKPLEDFSLVCSGGIYEVYDTQCVHVRVYQ